MNIKIYITHLSLMLTVFAFSIIPAGAQSTSFTYQGRLTDNNAAASGAYQMKFTLFDSNNNQIGSTIENTNVTVTNGNFTVQLDFGAIAFNSRTLSLQIAVKRPADAAYTTLGPNQPITPVPLAIRSNSAASADTAANATTADSATDSAKLGGVTANQYVLTTDPRLTSGTGTFSANIINAQTQYNIAGNRVISDDGSNFFAGVGAGNANTTGVLNTFVGSNAGSSNTDGFGNSFFGRSAGSLNTTGTSNSFFGQIAGFFNTTGSDNSFFGRQAGYSNSSGWGNSFFGRSAGYSNTTSSFNTFVGFEAGYSNTNQGDNSFFGWGAGRANTAYGNSFFGSGAGYSNTVGGGNAFFGIGAGFSNTTGGGNSFFGRGAGSVNTTGSSNAFFGSEAGRVNEIGADNSFFGTNAGYNNTSGGENAFFGKSAGLANSTGANNAFFGRYAGQLSNGSNNAFFGHRAGENNSTGSNNSALGKDADFGSNNLTYATAIGSGAVVPSSNTILLGRMDGSDKVRVPGLGAAGGTALCRNSNNEISTCSSSLRYKTNVVPFGSGLNIVNKLKPITFDWKSGGLHDLGLGAEDVAAVEPLLATYNSKGEVEGVKYDRIGVVLLNAVREQQGQIEEQQKQIKTQQQQNEEQKTVNQNLQTKVEQQQRQIDALIKLVCSQDMKAEVCKQGK